MNVYAAQWQDPYEPWGWETDSVWYERDAAGRRVVAMIAADAARAVDMSERWYAHKLKDHEAALAAFDPNAPFIGVYVGRVGDPPPRAQPPRPPSPPLTLAEATETASRYHRVEVMIVRSLARDVC